MRTSNFLHVSLLKLSTALLLLMPGCKPESPHPRPAGELANGDVSKNQELARDQTDQAFTLIANSHFDQAEDILKKALIADPLYGPAHNDMGLVEFHRHDLYDAAWEFENAARLMPQQPAPTNNLGLVLENAGKFNEAEKSYATAVELDPDNPEYAGNYARARIRLGQRDETTKKLLDLIIMRDRRPEWIAWAREQASRIFKQEPITGESP